MITEIRREDGMFIVNVVILPDQEQILKDEGIDYLCIELMNTLEHYTFDFTCLVNDKYGFIVYTNYFDDADYILLTAKEIATKYNGCVVLNK